MSKFRVCLTGGIASGKTHVSDQLSVLGAHVIDADLLARRVVEKKTEGLARVVDSFGLNILNSDKSLNRQKLKEVVFSDKNKLVVLNSILHPLIKEAFEKESELNQNNLEVWVIPLFNEKSEYRKFNRVLVVDVEEHIQVDRVVNRDQVGQDVAHAIIDSQISRKSRLKLATDVINNSGGLNSLDISIEQIFSLFDRMKNRQSV